MSVTHETRLDVRPQSGWTGAEIHGVNLSQPLGDATVAEIRQALLTWKVVFFRDQYLDHAAQIRFGQYFGDVTPGNPGEGDNTPEGYPQIHTVSRSAYARRHGARQHSQQGINGPGWHADVTPLINPPAASILS